jgi:LPS-assembly protein
MKWLFLSFTTMDHQRKGKANYVLAWAWVVLLTAITEYGSGSVFYRPQFHNNLTCDTLPKNPVPSAPSVSGTSSPVNQVGGAKTNKTEIASAKDSVIIPKRDTLSFRTSKDSLDAPVAYHADDSMVLDIPEKKIYLYGKQSSVKYIDNELLAPHIEFDQRTSVVSAFLVKDSNGKVVTFPTFTQADFKTVSDSIRFNMKTLKGITKGTYTRQGEMFVYGEKIKKVDLNVFYAFRARFTTCNLDTPHFAFVAKRVKFINKKMAFTGPVHPEVEGVPIPIYLPFGIYPLTQGRHSGILAPTFSANAQYGLALEGMGYYKILNQNWDLVTRGTIYSYGGWAASVSPRYFKRYHYQGNMTVDIQHFRDIDNNGTRTFNIRWTHASDSKARPGVSFNASVNAGSSKFNSTVPNSPQRNFQNQLSSSITYSKVWKDKPFNLTISANHNQNTTLRLFNINLPDVSFNVNTLYPFRDKERVGNYKWYENIGVALNSNVKSLSSFYDTSGNIVKQLLNKLQWGGNHNVPITLSLPSVWHLQLSPNITYQERWYQQKFIRSWDNVAKKVDTTITKGFSTGREMQFGMGVSTRIFGTFTFGKHSRVQAIRHEIRPSFSISYKPDLNKGAWYSTQIDTLNTQVRFSKYDGSIFGGFSEGRFGGINFGLDNNLQMKIKNRKDTGDAEPKKITLLDGFSISGSYNFLADSFRFTPLSLSAHSSLFGKVNITASGSLDPYLTDINGNRINKLVWTKNAFSLGKLTSGSISIQSQFKGGDKNEKLPQNPLQPQLNPNTGLPLNEYQQEASYISNNPGEFANFNIPWSTSFSYSLSFVRQRKPDYSGFESVFSQNVNWTGTLNLTKKWQIGLNGYYNLTLKQLGTLSLYLTREMHCWQMAINISPVGIYRFFNISISPKSSILRDLKINRTRYFYDL